MKLSKAEVNEIFLHMRTLMKRNGFSEFDEKITRNFDSDGIEPRGELITYLSSFIEHVQYSSRNELGETLAKINSYVETEGGGSITGVDLMMTEGDGDRYGVAHISLQGAPFELDETIEELREILAELKSEDDNDQRAN